MWPYSSRGLPPRNLGAPGPARAAGPPSPSCSLTSHLCQHWQASRCGEWQKGLCMLQPLSVFLSTLGCMLCISLLPLTRWPVPIKVLHCLNHVAWFKQCDPVLASNLWKPRYLGFTSLHCLNHVASTNRKPGLTKVPGLGRFGFSYICVQILKFGGILQFLWFELKTTNQWMTDQGMWRAAGTAKNCARGLL